MTLKEKIKHVKLLILELPHIKPWAGVDDKGKKNIRFYRISSIKNQEMGVLSRSYLEQKLPSSKHKTSISITNPSSKLTKCSSSTSVGIST